MNGKVTESIFSNERITIPLADVQNVEKQYWDSDGGENGWKKGDLKGGVAITKHTKWNFEHDCWENAIWLGADELGDFLKAWCRYRGELESDTLAPPAGIVQDH